MRSLAREVVFKYIFSRLFNPCDEGLFDVLIKDSGLSESDKQFATELLGFVTAKEEEYLNKIESLAEGYKLDRVFNTDKCALIIGMAEFDNYKQTPVAVIVNEAVNLSAKFSTEKSTDFVNGILAKYVMEK
jgi:N utilization substance protein B